MEEKKMGYEEAVKRLEKIVAELEDGSKGLDESLKLYEEGTKLAALCNELLESAEQKIVKLQSGEILD